MTQKEKAKLVPVSREPALLTERDADKSPVLECIDLGITFGGLKAVDSFNITIGRTEIAEQVWETHFDTGTNFIDVYINYLRKKVDRDFEPRLIHTRPGMGFILTDKP